jgi:CDP-diglyceride synthetase
MRIDLIFGIAFLVLPLLGMSYVLASIFEQSFWQVLSLLLGLFIVVTLVIGLLVNWLQDRAKSGRDGSN